MKFISVLAIGANKGYIKIESFTPIFQKKLSSQRGQAHFKIYDAWTYWESTKVIRIKFTAPEYQLYNNVDHKPDWILSEEEKVHLMELLTANDCKLWKALIRSYNWEVFGHHSFIDGIPEDLPIPDYTKLK